MYGHVVCVMTAPGLRDGEVVTSLLAFQKGVLGIVTPNPDLLEY